MPCCGRVRGLVAGGAADGSIFYITKQHCHLELVVRTALPTTAVISLTVISVIYQASLTTTVSNMADTTHCNPEVASRRRRAKPWKYVGYPGFSHFVASDHDFFMLRAFSKTSARVLLMLQDEIVELEMQLAAIDQSLSAETAADVHNGSFREETSDERKSVLHEMSGKLRYYNEFILQHSELRKRLGVPRKDQASIQNWLYNHNDIAILPEEADFVNHSDDLFAVVARSKTPLRRLLERSQHFRLSRLWRTQATGNDDENVHYHSDARIDTFVSITMTTLGTFMLVAPLWILGSVSQTTKRLAIITAFLIAFLCLVSFTTVSKPFETLGAAAA